MTELVRVRGPLGPAELESISALYGPVDHKYESVDYVGHQFVDNPFGWSVHVFVKDGERAVGHCGVVPFRARLSGEAVTVGKLEALAVEPAFRGRREDGGSTATDLLSALYAFAHEEGLPVLFGLAPPGVDRIHVRAGCRQVAVHRPAFVLIARTSAFASQQPSRRRRIGAWILALAQRLGLFAATASVRLATASFQPAAVTTPEASDATLATASADGNAWTVSGADAWDWYVGSGVLQVVEIPGRRGSRALVKLAPDETVQIVSWRPGRASTAAAILLLGSLVRLARRSGAPTLRFQPWRGDADEARLARTCRRLGFVQRPEVDLVVHSADPRFDEARLELTPFFYVTF
jgi:hypothetical protein